MRHTTRRPLGVLLLVLLQAIGALAASLKTTYTLAYAPVATSSTSPTPFAVLVSSPAAPTFADADSANPPNQKQGSSSRSPSSHHPSQRQQQQQARPAAPPSTVPVFALESYTPPKKSSATRAQIGVLAASGKAFNGSSTLASLDVLQDPLAATLFVQLGADGAAESVSLREAGAGGSRRDGSGPAVEVLRAAPEPRPVLSPPVVLNAEGRMAEEPKEKTLLQRYWWVGLALVMFTMVGGGGGGESK